MITAASPWTGSHPPERVLAMRFQAIGDVMITLPYLQALREMYPAMRIDLLTREEAAAIPEALSIFNVVFKVGGGRRTILQVLWILSRLPVFWSARYDLIIDLQNHRISRLVRRILNPKYWSEFDRWSRELAAERTRRAIGAAGFQVNRFAPVGLSAETENQTLQKFLLTKGKYVVLNPAGAFPSRWWPETNYTKFAEQWKSLRPDTKFVVIGFPSLGRRANAIGGTLGSDFINLCGQTNAVEAFALVGAASLVVSEDSGLMHMAWVQHTPTVALFGSSPSYWAAPTGPYVAYFHSSDMDCGNCMLAACKYGDNRCLTRYNPGMIFDAAIKLVESKET